MIIGQEKILSLFEQLFAKNSMHHAYAFIGPNSLGKETLALHFASKILNISTDRLSLHPDFLYIERIDEDGELKKDITVDHIEKINKKIIQPPLMGKQHVIIIKEAEKMNIFASNALLKILEEPPTPSIFFLLSHDEEKLLGTIRSRVQCLHLERPNLSVLREALLKMPEAQERKDFEVLLTLSDNLPGQAILWLQNPESFTDYQKEVQRFFSLFGKSFYEKLSLVEDLYSEKKAHIEGRAELDRVLNIWLQISELFIQKDSVEMQRLFGICPQVKTGTLVPFCDMILEAKELLSKNVHPRLVIEHILLCLS